jgi:hypothetical protein
MCKFAHTTAGGKVYQARYCDLDAIIAVGYRVNSYQATQFRIWATKTLQEFRYGMACRFGPPNLTGRSILCERQLINRGRHPDIPATGVFPPRHL